MRHAKELINRVTPDFKISTSCLYTYTMNYRKGSRQAERHHHDKGVNGNISLHKAPNTSQNIYSVNAHWSTSHVNYLLDSVSENVSGCFLDSKDTVGTVVDVLWTEKDLEETNWDPGWYRGEVQRYNEDDDKIFVFYFKDRAVYSLNVTGAFADDIIRPAESQ